MTKDFIHIVQPAIHDELDRVISRAGFQVYPGLESILKYHLGLEGGIENPSFMGKRIRPLLVLMTTSAVGADWRCGLPSAAAVELLHNFSLIHDDIEDHSQFRRGRETVWKKWGVSLAINAGDTMYALAFRALDRLVETVSAQVAFRSLQVLIETCLHLTGGQHLDISMEQEKNISLDTYWAMVGGKTAALISASMRLGAIAGQAFAEQEYHLGQFGHFLGLGFQAWDDWLGIWGNPDELGKSVESDLVAGKKTLPVAFGLEQKGRFAERWERGPIFPNEVTEVSNLLIEDGARTFTEKRVDQLTSQAIQELHKAKCDNEAGENLEALAKSLLNRRI